MTVTREQAQMLTHLAIACRPHRAPTWDAAGVMAAIEKVRDRSLAEVVLAVVRAAADRECVSPGVIPSNGSHWQEQLKAPKWEPTILEPAERCGICAHANHDGRCPKCPAIDDHLGEPDFKTKRDGSTVHQIVESIKAEVAPTSPPPEPRSLDDLAPDPRAEAARAAMTDRPMTAEPTAPHEHEESHV